MSIPPVTDSMAPEIGWVPYRSAPTEKMESSSDACTRLSSAAKLLTGHLDCNADQTVRPPVKDLPGDITTHKDATGAAKRRNRRISAVPADTCKPMRIISTNVGGGHAAWDCRGLLRPGQDILDVPGNKMVAA